MKFAKLFLATAASLLLSAITGSVLAASFGWDPGAAIAGTFIVTNALGVASAFAGGATFAGLGTITTTDIVTQYGAYYLDHGQNQNDIMRSILRTRTLPTFAQRRYTANDVWRLSTAEMTNVLQPFHKTTSHKGNVTFAPKKIELQKVKVDQLISPDDVEETWLGFLASLESGTRAKWPIVRYIWEVLLAEKAQADYEEADWDGDETAAPGGGTAGSHLHIYDGLKKLVDDGITAGDINDVTLTNNPAVSTEVFAAVEEFIAGLPQHWAGRQVDILMPQTMQLSYLRDKRNTHGQVVTYTNEAQNVAIDFRPNWRIVPFGGMDVAGDNYIIATPRLNLIHALKTDGWRMEAPQVTGRQVLMLADWFEGIGFADDRLVYAYQGDASAS